MDLPSLITFAIVGSLSLVAARINGAIAMGMYCGALFAAIVSMF